MGGGKRRGIVACFGTVTEGGAAVHPTSPRLLVDGSSDGPGTGRLWLLRPRTLDPSERSSVRMGDRPVPGTL